MNIYDMVPYLILKIKKSNPLRINNLGNMTQNWHSNLEFWFEFLLGSPIIIYID